MKTSLIILTFLLLPLFSEAQFRYSDLRVEVVTPKEGSVIQSPTTIHEHFRIYNLGPDTIYPTDTMSYALAHYFDNTVNLRKRALGRVFAPGDSIEVYDSQWVNSPQSKSNFNISFIRPLIMWGPDSGKQFLQNEYSSNGDLDDNQPVVYLIHKGTLSTNNVLDEAQFAVYPNPSFSEDVTINISDAFDSTSIKVYNQMGQLQHVSVSFRGSQRIVLSTSRLPRGTYFIHFANKEARITKKLLVM